MGSACLSKLLHNGLYSRGPKVLQGVRVSDRLLTDCCALFSVPASTAAASAFQAAWRQGVRSIAMQCSSRQRIGATEPEQESCNWREFGSRSCSSQSAGSPASVRTSGGVQRLGKGRPACGSRSCPPGHWVHGRQAWCVSYPVNARPTCCFSLRGWALQHAKWTSAPSQMFSKLEWP